MSTETEILSEVESLKAKFGDTRALCREVCALLFFRYGITPTANKLYQYVRRGSMNVPTDEVGKFWGDLRQRARVDIQHPDLPDPIKAVAAEAIGTAHVGTLTVPTGELWFVNNIQTTIPASGGANIITANWYCSLWTDRVGALGYGQAFHLAAINFGAGGGAQLDEFSPPGPVWALTNKQVALRLPAGTVLTVVFTNTVAVAAGAVNCLFQVFGWLGKNLVA